MGQYLFSSIDRFFFLAAIEFFLGDRRLQNEISRGRKQPNCIAGVVTHADTVSDQGELPPKIAGHCDLGHRCFSAGIKEFQA